MPSDLYAASKEKLNEQIPVILSTLTSLLEKLRQEEGSNTLMCSCVLQCLSHLLSWISLTDILNPGLINTIFAFTQQGIKGDSELGTHAMACINEIVGRNLVPVQMEEFILQLFQQTLQLLIIVTEGNVDSIEAGLVASVKIEIYVFLYLMIHSYDFDISLIFDVSAVAHFHKSLLI
jgi:hypothetical protein